ncbi:hypothetical protein AB0D27_15335 [Streptomyces sp. NPDC048415]|uniref:hypothetical protein n=1 Tax=Streptomyces sp. NPDC048415 TaxID=3154822 RepID=UPI003428A352
MGQGLWMALNALSTTAVLGLSPGRFGIGAGAAAAVPPAPSTPSGHLAGGGPEPRVRPEADSAFVCGTACEVLPVSRIDDHTYEPRGNSVIQRLITGYRALTDEGEAVRPWGH